MEGSDESHWWFSREMGDPTDKYNAIPFLKDDEARTRHMTRFRNGVQKLLRAAQGGGWELVRERDGVVAESRLERGSELKCFRGTGVLNATAELCRLYIAQIDLRPAWDADFLSGEYKLDVNWRGSEPRDSGEAPRDVVRVQKMRFRAPWPVSSREFLSLTGETLTPDGKVVLWSSYAEDAEYPVEPEFVRGRLYDSGYVLEPVDGDPRRTRVVYVCQVDAGGWLPTWVINLVNTTQPFTLLSLQAILVGVREALGALLEALAKGDEATPIKGDEATPIKGDEATPIKGDAEETPAADWSRNFLECAISAATVSCTERVLLDQLGFQLMRARGVPRNTAVAHMLGLGRAETLGILRARFSRYM